MWQHYYAKPEIKEMLSLQLAQLTSVLANVHGNKTTTQDFMIDFGEQQDTKVESIEERVKRSSIQLSTDLKKI